MLYKDSERKKEWERLHRPQRLARRRELRCIAAVPQAARPEVSRPRPQSGAGFPVSQVTGGGLAAYNPTLGMAAGGALAMAGIVKKGWRWWKVGLVLLAAAVAVALFVYLYIQAVESRSETEE